MSKSIRSGTVVPNLQVVKKDRFYFTLNDTKLQVYRHLEKLGRCGSVEVERVSLKEVPEGIRKLMTVPDIIQRNKANNSKVKVRKGKYHSISTFASNDIYIDDSLVLSKCSGNSENEETDNVSETSESDHSDVDISDWSDDDISDTDVELTGDEHRVDDEDAKCDENQSFS